MFFTFFARRRYSSSSIKVHIWTSKCLFYHGANVHIIVFNFKSILYNFQPNSTQTWLVNTAWTSNINLCFHYQNPPDSAFICRYQFIEILTQVTSSYSSGQSEIHFQSLWHKSSSVLFEFLKGAHTKSRGTLCLMTVKALEENGEHMFGWTTPTSRNFRNAGLASFAILTASLALRKLSMYAE